MNSRLIVLMALSCPSQIGTAVRTRIGAAIVEARVYWLSFDGQRHSRLVARHAGSARKIDGSEMHCHRMAGGGNTRYLLGFRPGLSKRSWANARFARGR